MTDTEETAETSGTADAQKTMESQETESMQNREGEQKAEADTDETNSNKENVKETADSYVRLSIDRCTATYV